jgi:hypothetical protein
MSRPVPPVVRRLSRVVKSALRPPFAQLWSSPDAHTIRQILMLGTDPHTRAGKRVGQSERSAMTPGL